MIRPGLFLCGVAAMVASACTPAPAEMTDAERAAVEASARSAFDGIVATIASADQDGLMSYVADGSIFAFHGMVWDRAGLASTIGDFYGSISKSDMENFSPLQFNVLGPNAVVVTSQNTQTTTYDDGMMSPVTISARTFVMVRDGETWQILHGHISQHVIPTD